MRGRVRWNLARLIFGSPGRLLNDHLLDPYKPANHGVQPSAARTALLSPTFASRRRSLSAALGGLDKSVNVVRVLRILVLCELGLVAAEVVALFWQEKSLPPLLQEYLATEISTQLAPARFLYVLGGVVPFAGFVIGSIGLMRLWRPARELFLTSLIVMELVGLLSRPKVFAPPVALLDTVGSIIVGAILAVTYFTEIRVSFSFRSTKVHRSIEGPPNPPLNPTGAKGAPAG
jgi:hypothetical protein